MKFRPTVPLNSVLMTADRKSETVKGKFYFASYLPDELQVGLSVQILDVASSKGVTQWQGSAIGRYLTLQLLLQAVVTR